MSKSTIPYLWILLGVLSGNPEVASAQVAVATDGIAVFEAEDASASIGRGGRSWILTNAISGFSGSGYVVVPNSAHPDSNINVNVAATSPELQYAVSFPATGTYRVWVRAYGLDGTEDSVHSGLDGLLAASSSNLNWTAYGSWTWTNGASRSVSVVSTGQHFFSLWMREDGARIDRIALVTNTDFRAAVGNAFHIPNNYEADLPRPTMRFPLNAIAADTPVEIYNGNQFRGGGNPGNQLGNGSAVIYRTSLNGPWTELPMAFVAQGTVNTNNKYFGATIPAGTFQPGDVVQYYLRVPYDDHLPTYLYGTDTTRNETEFESVARASPYTFSVQSSYLSISNVLPDGIVEARVFTNSGDLVVAGPDMGGTPFATMVHFTPAARIAGIMHPVGAVVSAVPYSNGFQMAQQLHTGIVTSRLTFLRPGVVQYEIIHFGNLPIEETRITSPSTQDEHFYGFGEKFNSVDQAGRKITMQTWDPAGTKGDLAYKVVPWFMSTRGYGFHLDSSAVSFFDMRAASPNQYIISNQFASLKFNVVFGPRLDDVLSRYTGYTGRPAMSPPWAFGVWMSSDHWRDGGELRYVVDKFREHGLPGSAFVFDSPWEIAYNDLTWNMTQFGQGGTYEGDFYPGFGSVGEMMQFFRTNGWKVIPWMTPFINRSSNNEGVPGANLGQAATYAFASNSGYFVRNGAINGPPLVASWWKGSGSPIDFTRADAANWWMMQLSNLVAESGGVIGGWKTDDGESRSGSDIYIPTSAVYSDGRTGVEMRNGYCVEYHRTVWNVLGTNGVLFARSGFTGSQAFPGYWSGDNEPNFGTDNGLLSVIVAGQTAGLCGFSTWGHDIAGYQTDTNPSSSITNLFMRWTQFGAFSPIFQLHRKVAGNRQYPWSYGAEGLDNFRFYAQLHQRLLPYLYSYARRANETGLPILMHPVLRHQDDVNVHGINHSYYFGDELFVAPATAPNQNQRSLYLPPGHWYDFWTNTTYTGGQLVTWTNSDQTRIALFVRDGAIIPMIATNIQTLLTPDYMGHTNLITPGDAVEFLVYPTTNSSFNLYDGSTAQCASNNTVVTFTLSSFARPVALRVRGGMPAGVQLNGVRLPSLTNETALTASRVGWAYDPVGFILVKFPHTGGAAIVRFGPDSVGDGIPNSWREHYFNDATGTGAAACATCDFDGDGATNHDEYRAGTDPTSVGSVMKITDEALVNPSASQVAITWPSQPNIPYEVSWKSNLADESPWYGITSRFIGDGNPLIWTDHGSDITNPPGGHRFYRIGVP